MSTEQSTAQRTRTFGAMSCTSTLSCTESVFGEAALNIQKVGHAGERGGGRSQTFLAALTQHLLTTQNAKAFLPSSVRGQ